MTLRLLRDPGQIVSFLLTVSFFLAPDHSFRGLGRPERLVYCALRGKGETRKFLQANDLTKLYHFRTITAFCFVTSGSLS